MAICSARIIKCYHRVRVSLERMCSVRSKLCVPKHLWEPAFFLTFPFCASSLYCGTMNVRSARIADVKAIYSLVSYYAERDEMLFRSMTDIYEKLQNFIVAEENDSIVGCCSLEIVWSDLAEIKSLAVDPANTNKGIGKELVNTALQNAQNLGVPRVFALTLKPNFFEKLSFSRVEKDSLPMKVWSDCARCPKQQDCDEIAVIKKLRTES
jgi:amino-acid N-acetyltransferase